MNHPAQALPPSDERIDRVRKICAEVVEIDLEEVDMGQSFADMGLDSMMVLELLVEVEKLYRVEFPEEMMARMKRLSDVLLLLDELQST